MPPILRLASATSSGLRPPSPCDPPTPLGVGTTGGFVAAFASRYEAGSPAVVEKFSRRSSAPNAKVAGVARPSQPTPPVMSRLAVDWAKRNPPSLNVVGLAAPYDALSECSSP